MRRDLIRVHPALAQTSTCDLFIIRKSLENNERLEGSTVAHYLQGADHPGESPSSSE